MKELLFRSLKDIYRIVPQSLIVQVICMIAQAIAVLLLLNHMLDSALIAFSAFQLATKYFLISLGRIPECAAFVNDYYEFIDIKEDISGNEKFESDFDQINVKNIYFSYPNTKHLTISNISFDIKNGESVGTHNELLQKKGEYYQLYKMQQKWYVE